MPKRKELTESEQKHKKIANRLAIICTVLVFLHFLLISIIFTWSDWLMVLVFSLLFIAPAYLANAGMVFFGGGKPIDGGRVMKDGRRMFGEHKSWSGIIKGPLYFGIPISIGIFLLFLFLWQWWGPLFQLAIDYDAYILYDDLTYMEYYFIGGVFPTGFISLIIRIMLCAFGAGFGDLFGSFIKRRFNVESGGFFPVIDQLDFALMAVLFVLIPGLIAPGLFWLPDIQIIIFLLILTPSVTIIGNNVAYLTGLKDVPW